ncbi:carboxyl transferase domain-containing protein [Streptomyces sp. NPDC087428]|uniref:carboxyl transferase domain-containing protein n=1 Tax=Streptomyces sp. NPDC087428 TaxID=3365788 RepID=UPI0038197CA3
MTLNSESVAPGHGGTVLRFRAALARGSSGSILARGVPVSDTHRTAGRRPYPAPWTGRQGGGQAARFARLCDSVGVPLLSLSDVPGCLADVARERGGIVRRGAGPLYALAEAVVPCAPAVPQKPYARGRPHRHELALEAPRVAARPGRPARTPRRQ